MPFINPIHPMLEKVIPSFYTGFALFSDFLNDEYRVANIIEQPQNPEYNAKGLKPFKNFLQKTGITTNGLPTEDPSFTDWYTLDDTSSNPLFPQSYLAQTNPSAIVPAQEMRRIFIVAPGYELDTSILYLFSSGTSRWNESGYGFEEFVPVDNKGYYGKFYSVICNGNAGKFAIKVIPTNS